MAIITLYNSKILLSLHCFLTPHFQTFTYLILEFWGLGIPLFFFFFLEIGRNYVSIIVNIIIITVSTETEKEKFMTEKNIFIYKFFCH